MPDLSHSHLIQLLDHCRTVDRTKLFKRLRHASQSRSPSDKKEALIALLAEIEQSIANCAERAERIPPTDFPPELPISERAEEIGATIKRHQVVIVAGETGSGKSTQLPKICLAHGRGVRGVIGHTQPRRIAARTIAARISEELGAPHAHLVGSKIRFRDQTTPQTAIKVMTDGILLAELHHDRLLRHYDTLIIDEAHERSLNIDFILGYLKRILPRRPDLKLVVTSATIDTQRFSDHFDGAPVIEVSGRTYPVELRWRPQGEMSEENRDRDQIDAILAALAEIQQEGRRGDTLVFLSGEREIRETAQAIRALQQPNIEVLPLYARLSVSEQNRVFRRGGKQRVVLATNVAETSLTVPGIRYVIDTGYARISRYGYRAKMQRLPIEPISQASADQRKGRCGRVADGVCIRLYAEEDYQQRPRFTQPEILRTSLASVILQMLNLHLGSVEAFPFLEPPERRMVRDGYQVLTELGAIRDDHHLSPIGQRMAQLPIDPRLARILLAGAEQGCLREIMIIAAALSIQDPRERPQEAQAKADASHKRFQAPKSDFLAYLNLWHHLEERRQTAASHNQFRQACSREYINYLRWREWREVHRQLRVLATGMQLTENREPADDAAIHRALLSGLLSHIAMLGEESEYLGARNKKLHIFPGSGLAKKRPKWILAAEVVETSRVFARCVAAIEPEWVVAAAEHLVNRHYGEPHWQKRQGRVAAIETISLFGLQLQSDRRVNYARINPVVARELFIRHALVYGEYNTRAPFAAHNQALLTAFADIEARTRRGDLMVHEDRIFDYFDKQIPASVVDGPSFERWRKKVEGKNPQLLFLQLSLLEQAALPHLGESFPKQLQLGDQHIDLTYRFEPGHAEDGVTAIVPLTLLNRLSPARCSWLVPGLLEEKIEALLRALPKSLRRNLVPVGDTARELSKTVSVSQMSLTAALSLQLLKQKGLKVAPDAWQEKRIDPHLRMGFRLLDEKGEAVAYSRNLTDLQTQFADHAREHFSSQTEAAWGETGLTAWNFGELPKRLEIESTGGPLSGFPALVDRQQHVDLVLLDTEAEAGRASRAGLARLAVLALPEQCKFIRRLITKNRQLGLLYSPLGELDELATSMRDQVIALTFQFNPAKIRRQQEFEQQLQTHRSELMINAEKLVAALGEALSLHQRVQLFLSRQPHLSGASSADIEAQLTQLVYPGFVQTTPPEQLTQLPRYLGALLKRTDKLLHNPRRDTELVEELAPHWRRCFDMEPSARRAREEMDEAFVTYRWMLEELRISLFAQELKTRFPISGKRMERQWQRVAKYP